MPNDLAVPPGLAAELAAIAMRDRRPVSDVLSDALERYLAEHRATRPAVTETPAEIMEKMLANRVKLPEGVTIRDLMTEGRD